MDEYHEIFEKNPDGVLLHDPSDGSIIKTNQQFCEMLGYSREELLELNVDALCSEPNPLTRERPASFARSAATDGPRTFEWLGMTNDGDPLPVEVRLRRTTIGGEDRVLSVIRDISVRKAREEKLDRLCDLSHELMYADSREETAKLAIDGAQDIIGAPLSGCHLLDEGGDRLAPVAVADAVETMFNELPTYHRDSEAGSTSSLVWEVYESGESIAIRDTRAHEELTEETPARSVLIHPLGVHGVFVVSAPDLDKFDQTDEALVEILANSLTTALDRVEREKSLRERSERLERQNERLDEFASLISHDLRNPLNVAQGQLELAQGEVDSNHLDVVESAHGRMEELIGDLLTLARETDTIELKPIDLEETVRSSWQNVATAEATLIVETDSIINADGTRIKQLLENLFRNAVEHGGVRVTVTVGDLEDGFYVDDDGQGIPEDFHDKIFETGYTTRANGTGFGLTIVKQIAEAHGWDITVSDSETGGARFEFSNPPS